MKIVICGLSITSSWGNGHATTYRALARALNARGHNIVFFERDLEWYASNRARLSVGCIFMKAGMKSVRCCGAS